MEFNAYHNSLLNIENFCTFEPYDYASKLIPGTSYIVHMCPRDNELLTYLYGLYSQSFIFNYDKFDISKKDEVLHREIRLCVDKEGFMGCRSHFYIATRIDGISGLENSNIIGNYIGGFIGVRRTDANALDLDPNNLEYHPTPNNIVYEIPILYINPDGDNKDQFIKTATAYYLLKTALVDKNEAFVVLRYYDQNGMNMDPDIKNGIELAGFDHFDYDKDEKIHIFIKKPNVGTRAKPRNGLKGKSFSKFLQKIIDTEYANT